MDLWVISSSYPRHPAESENAGVVARDVSLSLAALGHDVTVVTPDKPGGVQFDPQLRGIVLPWFSPALSMADLSGSRPVDLLRITSLFAWAAPHLRKAARRRPPEGIIALWALPSGIFARWVHRWVGAPYVVWLLGSDVWKAESYPRGRHVFTRVLKDSSAAYADGRVLSQQATALSGQPVGFLPSCRRLPPPRRGSLPAPVDVLFVGRYHPNKGPDVLLDAFAELRTRRPGVTLRLHGAGELESALRHQQTRLDLGSSVSILGPVSASELSEAMATAKVLAIPSRTESIPLILGDAIQAGLPVVASAVGDLPEVVEPYELGLTVPPEDPSKLASALESLLEEPRRLDPKTGPPWLSPNGLAQTLIEGLG